MRPTMVSSNVVFPCRYMGLHLEFGIWPGSINFDSWSPLQSTSLVSMSTSVLDIVRMHVIRIVFAKQRIIMISLTCTSVSDK